MTTPRDIAIDNGNVYDLRAPGDSNRTGTLTIINSTAVLTIGEQAHEFDFDTPGVIGQIKAAAADMLDSQTVVK